MNTHECTVLDEWVWPHTRVWQGSKFSPITVNLGKSLRTNFRIKQRLEVWLILLEKNSIQHFRWNTVEDATLIQCSHTYAYVRTLIAQSCKIFACLISPPKQPGKNFWLWKFSDLWYKPSDHHQSGMNWLMRIVAPAGITDWSHQVGEEVCSTKCVQESENTKKCVPHLHYKEQTTYRKLRERAQTTD